MTDLRIRVLPDIDDDGRCVGCGVTPDQRTGDCPCCHATPDRLPVPGAADGGAADRDRAAAGLVPVDVVTRWAPVQGGRPSRIPWTMAEEAYKVYLGRYGSGQSLERKRHVPTICACRSPTPDPAHRWSGWPGAVCQDCGIEDQNEIALADGEDPEAMKEHNPPCPARCTCGHAIKEDDRG